MSWVDITTTDDFYVVEIQPDTGARRHRRRDSDEWVPGPPPWDFQWYRDGVPIPGTRGKTTYTLTAEDEGCVVWIGRV